MTAKRVLIVDDSQTVRLQVAKALSGAGYEVLEAIDGVDGQDKIDATVDMVICDVNMPRMNGLEMLETIKRDGKNLNLPCLMLTTECQPQLIDRAKKAGAKGWIIKPFKAELLVAAVTKLVAAR
jgi:two-component system, chemotaxis family, chemotaxis protein CheY